MVSKQFQGITRDKWNDIKTVFAHETNVWIQSDEGSASTHGIDFSWLLSGDQLTVSLSVPHFGFALKMAGLKTEDAVMDKFSHWIEGVS
jgi:hypothetical protein